jgi:hypothetical protein
MSIFSLSLYDRQFNQSSSLTHLLIVSSGYEPGLQILSYHKHTVTKESNLLFVVVCLLNLRCLVNRHLVVEISSFLLFHLETGIDNY